MVVRGLEAAVGLVLGFSALTHRGLALSHLPRPTRCGRSHGCGLPPPSRDPGVLVLQPGWAPPAPSVQSAMGTWQDRHMAGQAGPVSVSKPGTCLRPVPRNTGSHTISDEQTHTSVPQGHKHTETQTPRLQRPSPPPPPGPEGMSRQKREGVGLGNLDQSQLPVWTRVSLWNCRGGHRRPDPVILHENSKRRSAPQCQADPSTCVCLQMYVQMCVCWCGRVCACVC